MSSTTEAVTLPELFSLLVEATHQGILGRDVDPAWRQAFVDELLRRAEGASLQGVVSGFVKLIHECPEAQERAVRLVGERNLQSFVAPGLALRPTPIATVSAGCAPRVAGMLRRAGLRRWAGPFDWMTLPPEAVRDALTDSLNALLSPRHLVPIAPEDRPAGREGHLARHLRYSEQYGDTVFHRADPSTEEGYAALERAALRLRDSLRGLHAKMLLQVVEERPTTPDVWAETGEALDRFARGAALVTVALVPGTPEGPFPEMELAESRGAHRLLRCRVLSAPQPLGFADLLDEAVILRGALATAQG